jgi:class 3 adenylate cyclase
VAGLPAEFKQVTVLFADVVHFMDIAAAVSTERLREIMTALVERSAVVVQRYGGTVDKFTGDVAQRATTTYISVSRRRSPSSGLACQAIWHITHQRR